MARKTKEMMQNSNGALTVTRHGHAVQLQRLTATEYYQALRAYGARDVEAQGATRGLLTFNTKGK
jgi:hypothetical protein